MMSTQELPMKQILVHGKTMAYCDMGVGDTLLFVHGNPTSSYLWRNIMRPLSQTRRCVAIDLIGMGGSEKLANSSAESYRFAEHRKYFDQALEMLGIERDVTLVLHDWGSALGFDWARRHPDAVRGIAYMEAIVRSMDWSEWPQASRRVFEGFRSSAGESMVLENNVFVEKVLPGSVLRPLSEEEMTVYRKPFATPGEDRRPTLSWPRQIPLAGEPADVCEIVDNYAQWMAKNDIPKLFVNAQPGAILTGVQREFCRTWPNQTEVTVKGVHFIQEDSPVEIANALESWMEHI